MQFDWRNCKCRGKYDVPLAARGCELVEVVTSLGRVTDSPDRIDWAHVSKWRNATSSTLSIHSEGKDDEGVIPEGYALLPLLATKEMEAAAVAKVKPFHDLNSREWHSQMPGDLFRIAWRAMIAAAPRPTAAAIRSTETPDGGDNG